MCDTSNRLWLSRAAAARKLGVNHHAVQGLVNRGCLAIRALPGMRPRISAADVERLERDSVRPARSA